MTNLLILGGSGRLAIHVLARADARGHGVRALVRNPEIRSCEARRVVHPSADPKSPAFRCERVSGATSGATDPRPRFRAPRCFSTRIRPALDLATRRDADRPAPDGRRICTGDRRTVTKGRRGCD